MSDTLTLLVISKKMIGIQKKKIQYSKVTTYFQFKLNFLPIVLVNQ